MAKPYTERPRGPLTLGKLSSFPSNQRPGLPSHDPPEQILTVPLNPQSSFWAAELVPPLSPVAAATCLKAAAIATDSVACLCP
ncbi:hypothetical protein FH972_011466 [Carpinus fangiana]|uniref:Uncharacterized protein n=1 Tax=Carpinus fangiana TaxID=176857 RepID=A0A660KRE8_9ROSI|nr:hypothetical protein FH972_011466 [Carpinus fangiana]